MKKTHLIKLLFYFLMSTTIIIGSDIDLIYQHRWEDQIKKMIEDKNYQKAKQEATKLIKKYPNSSEGYFILGTLSRNNQLTKSIEYLKKSVQLDSKNYRGYVRLAEIYCEISNKEKSLKYVNLAINSKPNDITECLRISNILYEYDKTDEAILLIRKTIVMNPNYFLSYYMLAMCYLDKGYYNRALELNDYVFKNKTSDIGIINLKEYILERRKENEK